jgi:hypothetical protein
MMPKTKDANMDFLNLKVPKDFKYLLKEQAAREKTTMQNMIFRVLQDYCRGKSLKDTFENAPYEDEELSQEELKGIEEANKDIKEGRTLSLEQYIEGKRL